MDAKVNEIEVNGVCYVPKGSEQALPKGNRVVLVLDRGWIFAGDLERKNDRLILTRALQVRHYREIGFEGMLEDPHSKKVTIKKMSHAVDCPASAELFCIPVAEDWGL